MIFPPEGPVEYIFDMRGEIPSRFPRSEPVVGVLTRVAIEARPPGRRPRIAAFWQRRGGDSPPFIFTEDSIDGMRPLL